MTSMSGCCLGFLIINSYVRYLFFFFQAEDGIRDRLVTGVQTCALPICSVHEVVSVRVDKRKLPCCHVVEMIWVKILMLKIHNVLDTMACRDANSFA